MDNMNPMGNGLNFPHFHPLNFRDYRNYLPTAYDDSLSMQESLLQVLNFCNEIGLLNQNMSDNWNMLLGWIKTNGIDDAVSAQLNAWVVDGTFEKILDKTSLDTIRKDLENKITAYMAQNSQDISNKFNDQDSHISSSLSDMMLLIQNLQTGIKGTYATKDDLVSAFPNGDSGIYVTLDDQNWNYWNRATNSWTVGGLFNAQPLTDDQKNSVYLFGKGKENLIKNGLYANGDFSAIGHNSGTGISASSFDGNDWAKVIGNAANGNTDIYFNLDPAKDSRLSNIKYEAFHFETEIVATTNLNLSVCMDVVTDLGIIRTTMLANATLTANQHQRISCFSPNVNDINKSGTHVKSVNIVIVTTDNQFEYSITNTVIRRFTMPALNVSDGDVKFKVKKVDNIFPDPDLLLKSRDMFGVTDGDFQYVEVSGRTYAVFTPVPGKTKYELYHNESVLNNNLISKLFYNNNEFKAYLYSPDGSDLTFDIDLIKQDNSIVRYEYAKLSMESQAHDSVSFKIPPLKLLGADENTSYKGINFTIVNASNNELRMTDIHINSRKDEPIKPDQLLYSDIIDDLKNNVLMWNQGVSESVNRIDGRIGATFTENVITPTANKDVYFSIKNPAKHDYSSGIPASQWKFSVDIVSGYDATVPVYVDVISSDNTIERTVIGYLKFVKDSHITASFITPKLYALTKKTFSNIVAYDFVIGANPKGDNSWNLLDAKISRFKEFNIDPTILADDNELLRNAQNFIGTNGLTVKYDYALPTEAISNTPKIAIKGNPTATNGDMYVTFYNFDPNILNNDNANLNIVLNSNVNMPFDLTVQPFTKNSDGSNKFLTKTILGQYVALAGTPLKINTNIGVIKNNSDIGQAVALSIVITPAINKSDIDYVLYKFTVGKKKDSSVSGVITNSGFPVLKLYGDMPADDSTKTTNRFEYTDDDYKVNGFTKTSWQGQSSTNLPKKSYKFKPYVDAGMQTKLSMQINPKFAPATDFVLKAFYNDPTLSLDNIGNEIMHDLAASRKTNSPNLNSTAYLGQCYGQPVCLYINDDFAGLYFFRSGAKKDTYGVDGEDPNAFVIEGEGEAGAGMFQAPMVTVWSDGTNGSQGAEFGTNIPDTLTDDQKAKFNAFVKMVNDGNIETFKANTLQTSAEAAIDYIIFYNLMGNVDSCGRNLEWVTWDNGAHFTVIPYDFDQMMFNSWDGKTTSDQTKNGFPVVQMRFGTLHNKYFDLIAQGYAQQLHDRYYEVRKTIMREDNVIKRFNEYATSIGASKFVAERAKWPLSGRVLNYQYIQKFVYDRFKLVDDQFATFIAPLLKGE